MQDQEKHPLNNTDDQEDFGLPEVNYNPIERENEVPPAFEAPTYYAEEEEEGPRRGWILASIIGFFVLVGMVIYLFVFGGLEQIASVFSEKPQPPVITEVPKKESPAPQSEVAEEPTPYEFEEEAVAEVNPLAPYEGISTISSPSGLSYIVVASFVDGDLANDFAMKMQSRDIGVKIIQPTQRSPLQHRVAVAEFNSFEEAMQQLEAFRQEYGEKAWVLKF